MPNHCRDDRGPAAARVRIMSIRTIVDLGAVDHDTRLQRCSGSVRGDVASDFVEM